MKKREPVSHIMSKDVHTVHSHQNLLEARALMDEAGIRHLPVVDGANVVGILSRTDIMRVSYGLTRSDEEANKNALQVVRVDVAMTPNPVVISPDKSIREAAEILAELSISALPVVNEGALVGILTTSDLIHFLLEQY